MSETDKKYLRIILEPIQVSAQYRPKFGQGNRIGGLSLEEFQKLYRSDSFYSWFGLDNPLLYVAHKAAGGMTSVYRQIGIGCERLFRTMLQDAFELSDEEVNWSYEVPVPGGRKRKLHLDGRVPLGKIEDRSARQRFRRWMKESAKLIGLDPGLLATLKGAVFEVRQGYKSKDSKRQNADIANAVAAYTKAYLPCVVILSTQIDPDILLRYRAEKWVVITGVTGPKSNPQISTYDFAKDVVGYDLAGFFKKNQKRLKKEVDSALRSLLEVS